MRRKIKIHFFSSIKMNLLLNVFVFCIILFLYLHIYYHIKTSDDLEVFTLKFPSKNKLEEICNMRQPTLFKYSNSEINKQFKLSSLEQNQGVFDVKIRKKEDDLYLPVLLKEAVKLFKTDTENFFSEKNDELLQETGLHKILRNNDIFLRPPMVSKCEYDFCSGSANSFTPLRYTLNYRNYLHVCEGSVKIKLFSPVFSKYLYEVKDYDNFEFRSPINPWNVQNQYMKDFNKTKFIEIILNPSDIIYIPAYWWYSIKYIKPSSVLMFKYRTYMNTIAILPHIFIHTLQSLNLKWDIVNKISSVTMNLTRSAHQSSLMVEEASPQLETPLRQSSLESTKSPPLDSPLESYTLMGSSLETSSPISSAAATV